MWAILKFIVLFAITCATVTGIRHCPGDGDADILSNLFVNCNPNMDSTHCPAERWLALFNVADIEHGHKQHYNFLNVGFNKGYNFATWLNVFAESWNIDSGSWFGALKATQGSTVGVKDKLICGSCNDCMVPPYRSKLRNNGTNRTFRIVGVELNKANIHVVEMVLAKLRASHKITKDMLAVDFVFGAAGAPSEQSPEVNTVKVPRCVPGDEMCRVPTDKAELASEFNFMEVPLISVDKLVKELNLVSGKGSLDRSHKQNSTAGALMALPLLHEHVRHHARDSTSSEDMVDILHIDTEGHDAEVLKSAKHLIQSHKIRAVIFEYHAYMPWGKTMLKEVLPTITAHHMECYFMGQNKLWPISNTCWHDRYEIHNWSNVMCVLKSDVWFKAIQPIIMTVEGIRSRYPEGSVIKGYRQQEMFLIKDNKVHSFNSMNAFVRSNKTLGSVIEVQPCHTYYLYPKGEPIV